MPTVTASERLVTDLAALRLAGAQAAGTDSSNLRPAYRTSYWKHEPDSNNQSRTRRGWTRRPLVRLGAGSGCCGLRPRTVGPNAQAFRIVSHLEVSMGEQDQSAFHHFDLNIAVAGLPGHFSNLKTCLGFVFGALHRAATQMRKHHLIRSKLPSLITRKARRYCGYACQIFSDAELDSVQENHVKVRSELTEPLLGMCLRI